MMKTITNKLILLTGLAALVLGGCSVDDPSDPSDLINPITRADAASQYVAIGNSLTAGYMDSGLIMAGQANSFPQLIAAQLGLDSDEFTQPWIAWPGVGTTASSDPATMASGVLYFNGQVPTVHTETRRDLVPDLLLASALPTPYSNLGVPSAFLREARNTYNSTTSVGAPYGSPNAYFDFITRADRLFGNTSVPADPATGFPSYETSSQMWQAIAQGPALVTLWLGGNDVLGAAASGEPASYPLLTSVADYTLEFNTLLQSLAGGLLARNGIPSTIVCGTIPHVSNTAHFMHIDAFTAMFGAVPFEEADVEYVLILSFFKWFANPTSAELPATATLDAAEAQLVADTIDGYNDAIVAACSMVDGAGLAHCGVMDANAALNALTTEQRLHLMVIKLMYPEADPGNPTAAEIAGWAEKTYFSLDGVHPNNRGYAYVANYWMDAITDANSDYSFSAVPPAAFTWDPTYSAFTGGEDKSRETRVTQAVIDGIQGLFR